MAASIRMCSHLAKRVFNVEALSSLNLPSKRYNVRFVSNAAEETKDSGRDTDTTKTSDDTAALLETLQKEKDALTTKFEDLQDKYKRSLAETENVRQRMKKQIDDAKLFGIQGFCKDLLEVADILGKATESVPKDQLTPEANLHLRNLYEGLTMTETQLNIVFSRNGLNVINPEDGDKFDPNVHEALFEQPVPGKEPGTIAVVTKIGYKLHTRTLRPALVGVYKAVS